MKGEARMESAGTLNHGWELLQPNRPEVPQSRRI